MDAATQQVDDEARVVLPAFAGRTVVVESVCATEARVRTVRRRMPYSFAEPVALIRAAAIHLVLRRLQPHQQFQGTLSEMKR